MADKEELKPGVFRNTSVCEDKQVAILTLYCDYLILSTPAVTKAANAGNLKSVHWGNFCLNIFKGLADEFSGFLISVFIIAWSTGAVLEACGS